MTFKSAGASQARQTSLPKIYTKTSNRVAKIYTLSTSYTNPPRTPPNHPIEEHGLLYYSEEETIIAALVGLLYSTR